MAKCRTTKLAEMKWHTRYSQNCEGLEIQLFFLGFILGHKSLTGANSKYGFGVCFIWGTKENSTAVCLYIVMTVRCLALGL